jgi:hypothetical protein
MIPWCSAFAVLPININWSKAAIEERKPFFFGLLHSVSVQSSLMRNTSFLFVCLFVCLLCLKAALLPVGEAEPLQKLWALASRLRAMHPTTPQPCIRIHSLVYGFICFIGGEGLSGRGMHLTVTTESTSSRPADAPPLILADGQRLIDGSPSGSWHPAPRTKELKDRTFFLPPI